jgi:vacuolar-type H+-ATPase subunit I/STV1
VEKTCPRSETLELPSQKGKEVVKPWIKVLFVTLLFGVPAFIAGPLIWPPAVAPGSNLLPFFLFLSGAESLTFGLGTAFLIFGWPRLRQLAAGSRPLTWAMFISIVWLLISWWPHDKLHAFNKTQEGLLFIEYGFHLTLFIGAAILAYGFIRLLVPVREAPPSSLEVMR